MCYEFFKWNENGELSDESTLSVDKINKALGGT